jgi:hypothetical protein
MQVVCAREQVVSIRMTGVVEAPAGRVLEHALEQLIVSGAVHVFWDMSEVANYHSEVRTRATSVLAAHRDQLVSVQVFSLSKVVEMGVAIANLSVGGLIEHHSSRDQFDAALRRALG